MLLGSYSSSRAYPYNFFAPDHLGSPRDITNSSKQLLARHWYLPFGEQSVPYAIDGEVMKFTGHERDFDGSPTYWDYMHARCFTPFYGRFLSLDPMKGNPSMPQSWNRYSYAYNNPTRFSDPLGLCTVVDENGKTWEADDCSTVVYGDRYNRDLFEWNLWNRLFDIRLPYLRRALGPKGGAGRGPAKPPKTGFTERQCQALELVVQREHEKGTESAADMSSNTWGDKAIGPFNTDFGGSNAVRRNGQEFDLDWYTDVATYTLGFAGVKGPAQGGRAIAFPTYIFGKYYWKSQGGTHRGPFQDPGESNALLFLLQGGTYMDLYKAECN